MKNITAIFIGIAVLIIAVFDIWIIKRSGNQESISAHLLALSEVSIFFPCLLGFTFGHLTWPNKKSPLHKKSFRPYSYIFFLINGIPAGYDFYQLYIKNGNVLIPMSIPSVIPFLISYTLGHYLWPMNPVKWSGKFDK